MIRWKVIRKGCLAVVLLSGVFLPACKRYPRNRSHADIPLSSIKEGEALSKVYCQSCHLLPDPALLDSRSWEKGVLPQMGPRLGIFRHGFEIYPSSRRDTNLGKSFYPSQALLKPEEWQHILDYYAATSPDSLAGQVRSRPIQKTVPLFHAELPAIGYDMPATTLVRVDTGMDSRGLFMFDIHYRKLFRFDPTLKVVDSLPGNGVPGGSPGGPGGTGGGFGGGLVDLVRQGGGWTACNIGVLNPNNGKFGKLQFFEVGPGGKIKMDTVPLFDRLARPVQVVAADLNQDGRVDYLVCEFGNMTGALSWLENKGDRLFERHVIRAVPGAIRAIVGDFNHDGLPDIMALFAQGDEGIFLFTNKGKGVFDEQPVLRFPPVYGSSYFELADFNKDGQPDILYTCGDNADFSPVLKPYHGVYIFMNDGHNRFTQRYFFPLNGCYKAMARDFDGDGDLDIATISFFADYDHQPEEGFVYLENLGGFDFQPYSVPEAQRGKWLVMDAGDLDGDGRTDIVLGNFSYYAPVSRAGVDFKKGPPFLFLRNKGR